MYKTLIKFTYNTKVKFFLVGLDQFIEFNAKNSQNLFLKLKLPNYLICMIGEAGGVSVGSGGILKELSENLFSFHIGFKKITIITVRTFLLSSPKLRE